MRKLKYLFLSLGISAAVVGTTLTAVYTFDLSQEVDNLRRSTHADTVYLRRQLQLMEADLKSALADGQEIPDCPVCGPMDGAPMESDTTCEDAAAAETESVIESEFESEFESESENTTETASDYEQADSVSTEAVTLPTHESPETESEGDAKTDGWPVDGIPPADDSSAGDSTHDMYIVSTHNDCIGVFDAEGHLLQSANVFVYALPLRDRRALEVGIPAYSWEEALRIVERYE